MPAPFLFLLSFYSYAPTMLEPLHAFPFHVEVRSRDAQHIDERFAIAKQAVVARAGYEAALKEWPDRIVRRRQSPRDRRAPSVSGPGGPIVVDGKTPGPAPRPGKWGLG